MKTSEIIDSQGIVNLSLEQIVILSNKIGMEYVEAKKKADRYDLLKASVRAKIMERLDHQGFSEVKIRRLAEVDIEFITFLEEFAEAKAEAERLRIRYDSYKNLFEAKRSELSYKKAEMMLL